LAAGDGADAAIGEADFVAAHERLRADPAIQFDMPVAKPPDPPPRWLIDLLHALAPYLKLIAWGLIAVAVGALLYVIIRHLIANGLPFGRGRVRGEPEAEPEWRSAAGPARQLLREADALAASGHYAEAVHLLLRRSIEEIERRRPHLVRPALTSRDIADSAAIPLDARRVFSGIAAIVETSLFGGRPVDAQGWRSARAAYEDFALPQAWR